MREKQPLLSIGMIVKNEMRCLKKCLDALAPLREAVPCELVIADTGSTDGTRELAAQYADILFDFTWCDDFSAARNAVLDRCHGLWHLQVDADEYLEDCAELVAFLRSESVRKFELGVVVQRNYESEEMFEDDYSDFHALRLLRRDTGARFEGSIHEVPRLYTQHQKVRLNNTVFHHDGYAGKQGKAKGRRNLPLLEKELEKDPGALHRVVQCLESSLEAEDRRKYARMAVEAAEKADMGNESHRYWCMAAFHDAVFKAAELFLPEIPDWVRRARELFPESILVGVGVSYAYSVYLVKLHAYEEALGELESYFQALERYDSGAYDMMELQITNLAGLTRGNRRTARVLQIHCFTKLKRYGELAGALGALDLNGKLEDALLSNYLNGVFKLYQSYEPAAEGLLQRMLEACEGEDRREARESFQRLCRTAFVKAAEDGDGLPSLARESWRVFLSLGDSCDLGRFARIMDAAEASEAEALLASVEAPGDTPPQAIEHALSLGAKLPEKFFRMKSEEIAALAAGVAGQRLDTPEKAMGYFAARGYDDPGRVLWGYHGANELAGRVDWKEKGFASLFEFYCNRGEEYLRLFHAPALCTDGNAYALPTLARFAYYCVQARDALAAGDELSFARRLREALAACPGMKDMVAFAAANVEVLRTRAQANPDMLMVAEKLRESLDNYADDDPVKQLLLNSKEYQLMVRLIGK